MLIETTFHSKVCLTDASLEVPNPVNFQRQTEQKAEETEGAEGEVVLRDEMLHGVRGWWRWWWCWWWRHLPKAQVAAPSHSVRFL